MGSESVGPFGTQPTLIMSGLAYSPVAVRAAAQEEGNQLAAEPETRKSRVSRGRGGRERGERTGMA